MRLLSVRLIVSLIVGVTLVSLGFSYYQVVEERRACGVIWKSGQRFSPRT